MELLVVAAILVIVSALMLANNREFGGRILLENLAYDIALTVRQAQVYGISVRQFESGSFEFSYGIYFNTGDTRRYSLFGDIDGNGVWDSGEDIDQSPFVIERGYEVSKLCVPAGESAEECEGDVERLDMIFKRPEPDACISTEGDSPFDDDDCIGEESARIVLISPRGDLASVVVEASGQIYVE